MEKIVFLLVCFVVLINASFALKCYNCTSEHSQGCIEGAVGSDKVICEGLLQHPHILHFCLRKTLYDKKLQKEIFMSTCEAYQKPIGRDHNKNVPVPESIIVLDRNIQQCQPTSAYDVRECNPCREDWCNAFPNSASKQNILNLLYLLVMYLFVKLY